MGAAYFIVLDHPDPPFDPSVNGKAIARDAKRLSRIAKALKIREPDDFVSMSADDASAFRAEFDIDESIPTPPEQWFSPEEGLQWVAALRQHLLGNPGIIPDDDPLLSDLLQYEEVLQKAAQIGARWHLSVDY